MTRITDLFTCVIHLHCKVEEGVKHECLCRIRPRRSSLKHFCMALIRPGDIMQIPVNVPRIRDEHCSLPPSPWCHRYDDGKNCRAKSNVWSTWNSELHAESKRASQTKQWLWWNFKGHSEMMALCTLFCTLHLIAFIAVSMETAEHFEAITDFPAAPGWGCVWGGELGEKLMSWLWLLTINAACV